MLAKAVVMIHWLFNTVARTPINKGPSEKGTLYVRPVTLQGTLLRVPKYYCLYSFHTSRTFEKRTTFLQGTKQLNLYCPGPKVSIVQRQVHCILEVSAGEQYCSFYTLPLKTMSMSSPVIRAIVLPWKLIFHRTIILLWCAAVICDGESIIVPAPMRPVVDHTL